MGLVCAGLHGLGTRLGDDQSMNHKPLMSTTGKTNILKHRAKDRQVLVRFADILFFSSRFASEPDASCSRSAGPSYISRSVLWPGPDLV